MQRSFEREAEILGSSLVDGNVSEKEIITNIVTLRDIAIMCETMVCYFISILYFHVSCLKVYFNNFFPGMVICKTEQLEK